MLERPTTAEAPVGEASPRDIRRWPFAFVAIAGLLGASGVVVGAAGAHVGGGDLARTSSDFLLMHAAAILGGAALALHRRSGLLAVALTLLAAGSALFGGELAFAALLNWRPLPLAAPIGGLCLIAGWLCSTVAGGVWAARR